MKKITGLLCLSMALFSCGGASHSTENTAVSQDSAQVSKSVAPAAESNTNSTSSDRYKVGDALNVLAKSGIVLREKADPAGAKVASIGYGQKVNILEAPGAAYEVEAFPGFKVKGNWVKVSASGKEGYVFDGFLSKLDAPKESAFEAIMKGAKSTDKKTTKPSDTDKNSSVWMKEVETFDNGATSTTEAYEGGSKVVESYPTKLVSLTEAYLLINAKETAKGKWSYDAKTSSLVFTTSDEMQVTYLKQEGGNIIVEMQTAD